MQHHQWRFRPASFLTWGTQQPVPMQEDKLSETNWSDWLKTENPLQVTRPRGHMHNRSSWKKACPGCFPHMPLCKTDPANDSDKVTMCKSMLKHCSSSLCWRQKMNTLSRRVVPIVTFLTTKKKMNKCFHLHFRQSWRTRQNQSLFRNKQSWWCCMGERQHCIVCHHRWIICQFCCSRTLHGWQHDEFLFVMVSCIFWKGKCVCVIPCVEPTHTHKNCSQDVLWRQWCFGL